MPVAMPCTAAPSTAGSSRTACGLLPRWCSGTTGTMSWRYTAPAEPVQCRDPLTWSLSRPLTWSTSAPTVRPPGSRRRDCESSCCRPRCASRQVQALAPGQSCLGGGGQGRVYVWAAVSAAYVQRAPAPAHRWCSQCHAPSEPCICGRGHMVLGCRRSACSDQPWLPGCCAPGSCTQAEQAPGS